MSQEAYLTTADMAEQLNVGESTLKLWRKRYTKWFPPDASGDTGQYSEAAFDTFQVIAGCTASGMAPADIEKVLSEKKEKTTLSRQDSGTATDTERNTGTGEMNIAGLDTILLMILEQQKKIAAASERRAAAEERKAFALESRAESEKLKANSIQEILFALKDNSVQKTVSSLMDKIQRMPGPSSEELESLSSEFSTSMQDEFDSLPELIEAVDSCIEEPETIDEVHHDEITEPPPETPEEMDLGPATEDIAAETPDVTETPVVEEPIEDMDDLSLLIDAPPEESAVDEIPIDMDDLSLLIDSVPERLVEDIDDLSLLIDEPQAATVEADEDIDDLSLLIDTPATQPEEDIDDLSLLISDAPQDIDDLSKLIDPPAETQVKTQAEPVKADKPAEDAGAYKSQVLSRIIKMKEKDGLSVEETTKIFNDEGLKTLSGKGEWDTTTIAGIYKYIESVREKEK